MFQWDANNVAPVLFLSKKISNEKNPTIYPLKPCR